MGILWDKDMKEITLGVVGIAALTFILAFYQQIAEAILMVGYVAAGLVAVAGVMVVFFGGWYALEHVLMKRAARIEAEKGADTLAIANEHGVFIRERNNKAVWLSLHQMPQWRVNGQPQEPTPIEIETYQAFLASRHAPHATTPQLLLSSGNEVAPLPDLLPILDRAQRVLIRAESDGGKTTLLQHIAAHRAGAVLVIDPHSYPDKWPSKCRVVGTGSNHAEISKVLDKLIDIMVERYREIGQGLVKEGEHPRLTVIIDEWMSIAHECANAPSVMIRLLTESRKAAFSIFVGSHSERVRSLGLDGKGDLKDGFLFVRISNENGVRTATYDYGRGERPCLLPGRYETESPAPMFEIEIPNTEADKDAKFATLVGGGLSRNAASQEAYGRRYAGDLVDRGKRALGEI